MNTERLAASVEVSLEVNDFSGVVSIVHQKQPIYQRARGDADRRHQQANTLDTRFGIASGTKFFTALAIGQLLITGKLSMATRLRDCVDLPFPQYAADITIEHLLTHTSGIPDYLDEEQITADQPFFVNRPWYELRGPRDYLPVFPHLPMKFTPGARFSYSNGGYIVLGIVIEAITGQAYQQYIQQALFQPLGMTRSGFFAFDQLPPETAWGYLDEPGGWRTNIYCLPIVGASDGGAYTTVGDLARLWEAFWGQRILPAEWVERFSRPAVKAESEGPHTYYGHGLWINQTPGQPSEYYLVGSDPGVSFRSGVIPAQDLQVTIISNTTSGAWPVARAIRQALLDET